MLQCSTELEITWGSQQPSALEAQNRSISYSEYDVYEAVFTECGSH
jgi:hypothetical protein